MENLLGDFWWVIPIGAFIGAMIYGHKRGRSTPEKTSISGAAIISSEAASELTGQVSRLATAAESIATTLRRNSEDAKRLRSEDKMKQELDDLREEIGRLRRGRSGH